VPRTILVVDDDFMVGRAAVRAFPDERVLVALTPDEGVAIARDLPIDDDVAILVDMHFGGGVCGADAIPRLRTAAPGAEILAMSALCRRGDQDRAISKGARFYVEKDFDALRDMVDRALQRVATVRPSSPASIESIASSASSDELAPERPTRSWRAALRRRHGSFVRSRRPA
jgi:CheY-like chemotaxis protein